MQCSVDELCSTTLTCTSNSSFYFTDVDVRSKGYSCGNSQRVPVSNNESKGHNVQDGCAGSIILPPHETVINSNSAPQHANDNIEKKQPLLFTQHARKQHDTRKESRSNRRAKFRSYSKYNIREQSFIGWTSNCVLPTWMFAKAGFFYKGNSMVVIHLYEIPCKVVNG